MNTIAIVGRSFHPDGKETAQLLSQSLTGPLKEKGYTVQFVKLTDILFDISNDRVEVLDSKTNTPFTDFAAVLMTNWFSHASIRKDIAYSLALYLRAQEIPFVNTEALYSRSTSKLSQLMLAALHEVPISRTVFCLNLQVLQEYLKSTDFPTPFIFKNAHASRGNGNYLLPNIQDVARYTAEHSETSPFIAQSFVTSDTSDYRLFVVNSKIQLVIRRIGQSGSHLNNTSAGAQTELIDPATVSAEVVAIVATMSQVLHREVTGIDVIFDSNSGKPYFLEANPIPQIATGSNVDAKLNALAQGLVHIAKQKETV